MALEEERELTEAIADLQKQLDEIEKIVKELVGQIPLKYRNSGLFKEDTILFKPKDDLRFQVERLSEKLIDTGKWPVLNELPEHLKKNIAWNTVDKTPDNGKWILYGNHRLIKLVRYEQTISDNYKDEIVAFQPVTHWAYIDLPPVAMKYDSPWSKQDLSEAFSTSSEKPD